MYFLMIYLIFFYQVDDIELLTIKKDRVEIHYNRTYNIKIVANTNKIYLLLEIPNPIIDP